MSRKVDSFAPESVDNISPESVDNFDWNQWTRWPGIRKQYNNPQMAPERVAASDRNCFYRENSKIVYNRAMQPKFGQVIR
ncbi:MAG: hypothetical protein ACRD1R_09955, partial [Acidobacteriota bacterium]